MYTYNHNGASDDRAMRHGIHVDIWMVHTWILGGGSMKARSSFSHRPLVSVILPAYNAGEFVEEAVDSILNQTYQNIELIVIDDGSTDDTKDVLKKYTNQIEYVYQRNSGPSEARNTGIKIAKGELIAYQDADDISLPSRIEREVELLLCNPHIAMVYTGMTNFCMDGSKEKRYARLGTPFELLQNNYVHGSTAMHWRHVLDTVGMWDETVDWGLYVRISEKFMMRCIPDCLYDRRLHTNNISTTRGRLKNRLIDLQMFKDCYERNKKVWMALKVRRIAFECKILEKTAFKNKRIELVFWYGMHTIANAIEKLFYIIERKIWGDGL